MAFPGSLPSHLNFFGEIECGRTNPGHLLGLWLIGKPVLGYIPGIDPDLGMEVTR
jgi:hypothetical protein